MSGLRILIVEDDEIIRDFLQDSLEMKGFVPSWAKDGEDALLSLDREEVDLVLSDVRMPGIGGIELARRIARKFPALPVVLITGIHAEERDRILEESGAKAVLPKPLRIKHLVEVLEAACSG
jgi:DNA-binding response OmpR family regulator